MGLVEPIKLIALKGEELCSLEKRQLKGTNTGISWRIPGLTENQDNMS